MAYVEEPCSQCGLILPKNVLSRAISEVQTARISGAVTTGTYAGGRSRYSYKSGQQVYQTREEWLCQECQNERSARVAAAGRARLIKWSLIALAVVVVLAFLRLAPSSTPAAMPAAESVPAMKPVAGIRNDAPLQPEAPAALDRASDETAAAPESAAPAAGPFVFEGEDLSRNPAFRAAAREALETGEAVLWGDHHGGEVRVGPLADTGTQACRSLTYSVRGARSADIFMCRDAQARWVPR